MTLKSFQFLAAALAAAVVLAFPQPGAAQAYSDSFEGSTINPWWTQDGHPPFGLSTFLAHTGSQSLEATGSTKDLGNATLTHVFSGPVRGDFSVWVYDTVDSYGGNDFRQSLRLRNAAYDFAAIARGKGGYTAFTTSDTTSESCALAPLAASPEWRKLRVTVHDTDIVFQVENGSGLVAACTLSYTASPTATAVELNVIGDFAYLPDARLNFDDFSYTPPGGGAYTVSLLYDPSKAAKSGSTIPIKLQLLSGGANVSSPSLVVHAVAVIKVDNSASSQTLDDAGNANPDFDFRYDPTLGGTGGYIFNLKTTGLSTGTYHLKFTVNGLGDYTAPFDVK